MLIYSSNVVLEPMETRGEAVSENERAVLPPDFDCLMEKGYALAIQILASEQDAADVIQESLRKLIHSGRYNSKKGSRQAFFLKIVRNGALDLIRRRKPHDEGMVAELVDQEKAPDRQVEQQELNEILRIELSRLSAEQRDIILLRDFHDLSYAEIAEVMGIRQGTVMSRLHRARTELQKKVRRFL